MGEWKTIDSAPKDGTWLDLWIVGPAGDVSFYTSVPYGQGRICDYRWEHRPPNAPNWYSRGGLPGSPPLMPGIRVTHWMLPPPPPKD